ncbi:hypothetical protein [Ferviditalea candida]|uniref:Uncharacterized protein n=1 Tax=Ferviditalea candida TaxID=3108399 RepID=A0ABU5ZGW6_9BACL|nr:hypothetical protein [Paenibacillaceae bacterium T2]
MRNRQQIVIYIVAILFAIGFITSVAYNFRQWLIPLVVFGIVFVLYKFPPKRYGRNRSYQRTGYRPGTKKDSQAKRNKARFRVIEGNKNSGDDNETPRYH